MNFFDADLIREADVISLQSGEVRIDLPAKISQQLAGYNHKQIAVGIRPEDLNVSAGHTPGKTIQSTVEVVEPVGNETYVALNTGSFSMMAAVGRKSQIKPHSDLVTEPSMDSLHLFDIESEKAIC
jgi:multiple sugar transport system ATP-binding protein